MAYPLLHKLSEWGYRRRFTEYLLLNPRVSKMLPTPPHLFFKLCRVTPPLGPKSLGIPELPPELRSAPGIPRRPEDEDKAFADGPLPEWPKQYPASVRAMFHIGWINHLLTDGARNRARARIERAGFMPTAVPSAVSAEELTRLIKAKAADLGISAIGIAPYDRRFTFTSFQGRDLDGSVIVCVLEQHWAATQATPGLRSELAHNYAYAQLSRLLLPLTSYIRKLGYRALATESVGMGISIHYGVEAGLGQMGLNGQLLTPFAGSRARLMLIFTDAILLPDHPRDYGVPAICDECQACVRRCPSGAIPNHRDWHRGVYKAKIKTERCLPIVTQAAGCAVCMKVCPVQRFGLPAVIEEFARTGQVLGKGSPELEGYRWPLDGQFYGPGKKPRGAVAATVLHPPYVDADRRAQATGTTADARSFQI